MIRNNGPLKHILALLAITALVFSASCREKKPPQDDPYAKAVDELSLQIKSLRAEVADYRDILRETLELEARVTSENERLFSFDPADRALAFLPLYSLMTIETPKKLDETVNIDGAEFGVVFMSVQGTWDTVMSLLRDIENYENFGLDSVEISMSDLVQEAVVEFRITYLKSIVTGESPITSMEIDIHDDESDNSTGEVESKQATTEGAKLRSLPEFRIGILKRTLNALKKRKLERAVLVEYRDRLKKIFNAEDDFKADKAKASEFLSTLPTRWPLGVPDLARIRVKGYVISISTASVVTEITPFWIEFQKEINSLSGDFIVNLNPVFATIVDGRRLDAAITPDKVTFSMSGMVFHELDHADVSSFARGKDVIYYSSPTEISTSERSLSTREWKPTRIKSISAVKIETRETAWETPVECPSTATNIVVDPKGVIVYGCGESLFFISPETGAVLDTVSLDGEALELAIGASERLIVRKRTTAGAESWVPVDNAGKNP